MKFDTKTILGLVITVASLWWAFHDVDLAEVWRHLMDANLPLLAFAAFLSTLGIHFRALRWRSLLPVGDASSFQARNAAVAVGFAANNVLPARIGEFARVFTLAKLSKVPLGTAFASLVLERVLDGFVILGLLFACLAWPTFPGFADGTDVTRYAIPVAVVAGGLAVGLSLLAIFPRGAVRVGEAAAARLPASFRRPIVDSLHSFVSALDIIRSPRRLLVALAWAVAQWLFLSVSYLLALRSFGITEPGFLGAVFIQCVVAIAVAVPAAPGFFGVSEAASKVALAPWGVPHGQLLSYAIGFHIAGWLPVTALGFWYASRLKISFSEMSRSEETVEDAVEAEPGFDDAGKPPRG
jgi:uncharacterized protein (TIRG00374 family)